MGQLTKPEGSQQQPELVDAKLFDYLNSLLQQAEAESGTPELELRAKIEALRVETKKVPSSSTTGMSEVEIASEIDQLSAKMHSVDRLLKQMERDNDAQKILASSSDLWMPVITASADERRAASSSSTPTCNPANEAETDASSL